jgi:hypothetical protein
MLGRSWAVITIPGNETRVSQAVGGVELSQTREVVGRRKRLRKNAVLPKKKYKLSIVGPTVPEIQFSTNFLA